MEKTYLEEVAAELSESGPAEVERMHIALLKYGDPTKGVLRKFIGKDILSRSAALTHEQRVQAVAEWYNNNRRPA